MCRELQLARDEIGVSTHQIWECVSTRFASSNLPKFFSWQTLAATERDLSTLFARGEETRVGSDDRHRSALSLRSKKIIPKFNRRYFSFFLNRFRIRYLIYLLPIHLSHATLNEEQRLQPEGHIHFLVNCFQ